MIVKSGCRFTAIIALILFLGLPGQARAQKYPLELSRSITAGIETESEVGSLEIEHDHASLILPILPFESFTLLAYFKEDQKKFSYKGFSEAVVLDGLSASVPLTEFPQKLVMSVRGALLAVPVGNSTWVFRRDEILAADQEAVTDADHAFMNQFMVRPRSDDTGKWFYGISHLGGIARESYWPLLGYLYKGESVRVNMVLPSYLILQVRLGEYGYLLLDETVTSESYRLSEEAPWHNAYLSQLSLTSRLEAGLRWGDFEIGISYGMTHFHSLTINNCDHSSLQQWKLKAAPVTSLQVQWNL